MAESPKITIPKMRKADFIEILASMTPQELNEMILQDGKPRRLINPLHFLIDGPNAHLNNLSDK